MKFEINQEVMELRSGRRCIVIATKKEAGSNTYDHTDNKKRFPLENKDYLTAMKTADKQLGEEMHVDEHQLFAL